MRHGVGPCPHGGSADDGQRRSPRARTGRPRASADDRCRGPAAYRCGGARVGQPTPVRTDLVDLAVWPDVCALRAHPRRLAEADARRAPPHRPTPRTLLPTRDAPLGQRRPGLARVIDSDAEALSEQPALAPRLTRLRQRIAPVEAPRQQLAAQAALDTDVRLIMGRLDDGAAPVQDGLAEADGRRTRAMIRALVTRVEVVHDQVNVVCRIEPRPGAPSAEKKSLHDCRGSSVPTAGHCRPARGPGGRGRAGGQPAEDRPRRSAPLC